MQRRGSFLDRSLFSLQQMKAPTFCHVLISPTSNFTLPSSILLPLSIYKYSSLSPSPHSLTFFLTPFAIPSFSLSWLMYSARCGQWGSCSWCWICYLGSDQTRKSLATSSSATPWSIMATTTEWLRLLEPITGHMGSIFPMVPPEGSVMGEQ